MQNTPRWQRATSILGAAVALATLAACTTPPAPDAPTVQRSTYYACERGPALVMHWPKDPGGDAWLEMNGSTQPLQAERVRTGFAYGAGKIYVTGKGADLTYKNGLMIPLRCVAR